MEPGHSQCQAHWSTRQQRRAQPPGSLAEAVDSWRFEDITTFLWERRVGYFRSKWLQNAEATADIFMRSTLKLCQHTCSTGFYIVFRLVFQRGCWGGSESLTFVCLSFRFRLPTTKCFCRKSQKCPSCGNCAWRAGGRAGCKSASPGAPELHQFLFEAVGRWAQVSLRKACHTWHWTRTTSDNIRYDFIYECYHLLFLGLFLFTDFFSPPNE